MKRTVITIALAAVLAIVAVACHDDPVTPTPAPALRNVGYIACGTPQQAAVDGDGWHALLDSLLTAAEGGCRVTFWNPDAVSSKAADTVTINTADRQQAYRWGEEMYDQGYVVSIIYDESTGTYHGTAVKSTGGLAWPPVVTEHTFYPFDEYLPGTWICVDYMAFIRDAYNPNQTWVNDYFFNEDYNPNHHPPLPYFSYIMPRMFLWPTSPDMHSGPLKMTITEDSITIEAPNVPLTTMDSNTMDYWTEEGDSLRIYTTHPDRSSY